MLSSAMQTLTPQKRRAIGALALMLVLAQIAQPYPSTAWLHHLPTLALLIAAPFLLRRFPVSDGAVVSIALFFALHTLGGRYTYSNVPYDAWFGIVVERNHYDRLVHFASGALLFVPVAEFARRHLHVGSRTAIAFGIGFVLSIAALYEVFEWLLTLTVPADMAADYNGQQGDVWDAQKDMALAFVGALGAWAAVAIFCRSRRP